MTGWWRRLRYAEGHSSLARRLLHGWYREGRAYRMPFGPLRGLRLRYDATINLHAMLGLWELRNFEVLQRLFVAPRLVAPPRVVCDVGANIGVYTLWFSRLLGPEGTVYAVEPLPPIAARLREHLALNQVTNVQVVEQACAETVGSVRLFVGRHHQQTSLHADWARDGGPETPSLMVASTTLNALFAGRRREEGPGFIKMDIEGGGVFALRGADDCLAAFRPWLLIESHMPAEDRAISTTALRHRYHVYRLNDHHWARAVGEIFPHPDGVWGTVLLCPEEHRARAATVFP